MSNNGRFRFSALCSGALVVFLVLFPKGGIKFGPLPITWGYLLLVLFTPVLLTIRMLALSFPFPRRLILALVALCPIQIIIVYAFLMFGVTDPPYAFSHFVSFFALPWIFLLVFVPFFPLIDGNKLSSCLRTSVLIAAIWGLFLFVFHAVTGHFLEVPYLTVNAQDFGQLESTKHINRGAFYKLISTYNNGNLYGVATLILLPLYDRLEPIRWRRLAVKAALLLTLSRTVWAGLLLNEVLSIGAQLWLQIDTFPRVYMGRFGRGLGVVFVTAITIFGALLLNHSGLAFLFDPTGGGRVGEIGALDSVTWFPHQGLGGFFEVVYAAVMQSLGIIGLVAFVILMASPVLLVLTDRTALASPLRRAALKGLILYSILAFSDGAFDFIPVMAFYWFTYAVYLFGWPGQNNLVPSLKPVRMVTTVTQV